MTIAEKLQMITENEQKVYQAGKKSQYNEFWDDFQQNGNRNNYSYAFTGIGWDNYTFFPKYDIVCGNGYEGQAMFRDSNFTGDFQQRLDDCGVTLDLSRAGYLGDLFRHCYNITRVGEINASNAYNLQTAFHYCTSLKTIDKLILKSDGSTNLLSTFGSCSSLENIVIEGVIGYNGTNFGDCTKLSGASLLSIVRALSTTTSGYSITFSRTAVTNAREGDDLQWDMDWLVALDARSNWTINLV